MSTAVLIAGAGPVGLTLALALQRQGVRVRLFDTAPSFSGESKAITLQPRTLELYRLLGVAEPLVEAGVASGVMNMHVGRERVTVLRYDRLSTPYPFYLHLHQGHTERALVRALEERGLTVERATTLEDFTQDEYGVTARLSRADGSSEEVHASFLVGCDGGHSRVRTVLGVDFVGARTDDDWIMTDVRIPNMSLAPGERHGYILERFPFVVLPLGGDFYRLISARPPDSPLGDLPPTLDEFRPTLELLGLGHWRLEEPLWLVHFRPSQRLAKHFRVGHVFLAGDAAHVNSPIAAQGLNTGAVDALNLAWKLHLAVRGKASERLLDSYHAERHLAARQMFAGNERLTRLVFGRNAALRYVARKQLHLLNIPAANLKNVRETSQLGNHYRASPVVQGGYDPRGADRARRVFDGAVAAPGDRAPHLSLDGARPSTPLYELLRPERHTLLVLGGARPDEAAMRRVASLAERHGDWIDTHFVFQGRSPADFDDGGLGRVWGDPWGAAHGALGARGAGAVLIRPDAHVATRFPLDAPESLDAYVGTVLR
ncbi:MAG TPA: FAD-dependent monooxygenase [Myxococcaceae bacterium]|nr:FAD-dependent monooxygenase [Myxococcaceae bacterium]